MMDYSELIKFLRGLSPWAFPDSSNRRMKEAAAAIEALQAEVKRLQDKLCDWCAVCPKERRKPEDCELLSETPVMYGPSDAKMEAQDDKA